MAEEKRQFPTEMVNLPSKGVLYPKESSISKGEIEVKYMTAKEEDILTSQNLIRKGIVIDKLLESLVVDESINLDDILIGDKNALMVASRVLGYGKDYQFELNCPACGERNTDNVDLTKLGEKSIDHSHLKGGKNEFNFELPTSKRKITYKLLTQSDEREIDAELKALKKISGGSNVDPEITTRLKRAIVSVDGKSDTAYVNSFVDNEFLSRDSLAFRNHLLEITPDVDMNYLFTCELCDFDQEVTVPMTVQFFWPSAKR
tara:strand:+ start:45 stop:824 length:780 start_codon:yes stop_codon:yes gene_type:complete